MHLWTYFINKYLFSQNLDHAYQIFCIYWLLLFIIHFICVIIIIIWTTIWHISVTIIVIVQLTADFLICIVSVWFTIAKAIFVIDNSLFDINYEVSKNYTKPLFAWPIDSKFKIWHTIKSMLLYHSLLYWDFK